MIFTNAFDGFLSPNLVDVERKDMIQFVVSRSDVIEHRTHEIFVSHIIYVNSQRTTDNSLCPYFYNCLFFVESNPQAAAMS